MTALLTLVTLALTASALPLARRQAPSFVPLDQASIHPGVNTNSNGGSYQGSDIYIGQAAHCASTSGPTGTDGCSSTSLPEGSEIGITGASRPGVLAYSSWVRMQLRGETDANACAFNDFAIVKIDPADHGVVSPTIPVFGGPSGLRSQPFSPLEPIFSYGNSALRQGITLLSPKYGAVLHQDSGDWNIQLGSITPGIPGDSGSAFFDEQGLASGTLSTLQFAPIPLANGVVFLSNSLDYARSFDDFAGLELALGLEDFAVALPNGERA